MQIKMKMQMKLQMKLHDTGYANKDEIGDEIAWHRFREVTETYSEK